MRESASPLALRTFDSTRRRRPRRVRSLRTPATSFLRERDGGRRDAEGSEIQADDDVVVRSQHDQQTEGADMTESPKDQLSPNWPTIYELAASIPQIDLQTSRGGKNRPT